MPAQREPVDLTRILKQLREERDRLDTAIAALETVKAPGSKRFSHARSTGTQHPPRRTRRLSPEGRRRISLAAKRRWAMHRKKAKATA